MTGCPTAIRATHTTIFWSLEVFQREKDLHLIPANEAFASSTRVNLATNRQRPALQPNDDTEG